jgi:acyl-CoA thioesterase-2
VILDPPGDRPARPPYDNVWFRAAAPVPEEFTQALLAYASDATLLSTSLLPHGKTIFSNLQVASLDHAMWFHRPLRFDDWLLFAQDSPSASGARGFNRGAIFARDGRLIASVAQEGLIRPR